MPSDISSQQAAYWHPLPGGASVAISPVYCDNALSEWALNGMRQAIAAEANTFKESYDPATFTGVVRSMREGRSRGYILHVNWTDCALESTGLPADVVTRIQQRRDINPVEIAGAAIEHPTVFTVRNPKGGWDHYAGIHGEDSYVDPEISALLRQFTSHFPTNNYPQGFGLGKWSQTARIKQSISRDSSELPFDGMVVRGRTAEHSEESSPRMTGIYKSLGTTLDLSENNLVLVFENDAFLRLRKLNDYGNVSIGSLASRRSRFEQAGIHQENVFLASWLSYDGRSNIVASLSRGVSSFTGKEPMRVQIKTNGLFDDESLTSGLVNTLNAAISTSIERGWADTRSEALSLMRIHALDEPRVVKILQRLGANGRKLGPYIVHPNETDFANMPNSIVDFRATAAPSFLISWRPANENGRAHYRRARPGAAGGGTGGGMTMGGGMRPSATHFYRAPSVA